ncbi:hypothetical protein PS9374_04479 [Planomonospora sphaerica]|uniref:Uncharacterized protein n=1 Tax=Planomonospora sphaerica TaxID=161355 RepID=A0A161LIZ9_9ACTN|nr:hypothetical protein PS9374_04479 [Planomonospora sphaerica]
MKAMPSPPRANAGALHSPQRERSNTGAEHRASFRSG